MNRIISNGTEHYLTGCNMKVIERDWRSVMGVADFVCIDRGAVVLVNVRIRLAPSAADNEVTAAEKTDYRRIALFYLAMHPEVESVRYDLITMNIRTDKITKLTVGTYQA